MEQLIDKSALVAVIKKLKSNLMYGACASQIAMEARCKEEAYNEVLSFLDTLEVKEVDLEKEIDNIWNPRFNLGWDEKSLLSMNHEGFTTIAKHFFGLGLKAQKGWSQRNAVVIEGICSDKEFIDTKHGILAFGAEEGSYRPFKDGDKVKIIIIKED